MFKKSLIFLLCSVLSTPSFGGTQTIVKADLIDGIQTVKNYVKNSNAEKNANNWTISKNTSASATPDNGFVTTSTSNTIVRSTSSPLAGDASFLYTLASLGDQVCTSFSIDSADAAKVLQGKIEYNIASGTYADDSATVWIYDVTNASFIQPTPYKIKNHLITSDTFSFEFQTSLSTSYKLCIHQAAASTAALKIDNVFVGRSAKAFGSPITDWVSYTPILSYGTGSCSTCSAAARYRKVGDSIEIYGLISFSGTSTAFTDPRFPLPSGVTIDHSKIANSGFSVLGGLVQARNTGVNNYNGFASIPASPSNFIVMAMNSTNTSDAGSATDQLQQQAITETFPFTFDSGDVISVSFRAPILGWGSTTQMSHDADTRVVAAQAFRSASSQTVTGASPVKIQWNGENKDSHNTFDSATNYRYVAPIAGTYKIGGVVALLPASAVSNAYVTLYKNGASARNVGFYSTPSSQYVSVPINAQVDLVAGDYLELYVTPVSVSTDILSSATISGGSQFNIERISGPSQIAASEEVTVSYASAGGTSIAHGGTGTAITNWSKITDTHNAFNTSTSVFTAPIAGRYEVSGMIGFTSFAQPLGMEAALLCTQAGSASTFTRLGSVTTQAAHTAAITVTGKMFIFNMLAGDTLAFKAYQLSGTSQSIIGDTSFNTISIKRVK